MQAVILVLKVKYVEKIDEWELKRMKKRPRGGDSDMS